MYYIHTYTCTCNSKYYTLILADILILNTLYEKWLLYCKFKIHQLQIIPYKMIYWQGINIGHWRFYAEIANIKSAILFQSEHAQWHVAQITNIKFTN